MASSSSSGPMFPHGPPSDPKQQVKAIDECLAKLSRKRPRALTAEEKLDVLILYHSFQREHAADRAKHPDRSVARSDAQARVVKLLKRSTTTVATAYSDWHASEDIVTVAPGGNRHRKAERIPQTQEVLLAVRKLVRDRRTRKQRTTARHVWDLLRQRDWLTVDETDAKACKVSLRSVQRYLQRRGFRRGSSAKDFITESKSSIDKRNAYFQHLADNEALPPDQRLRLVDLDESYIHHHYRRHNDSLFDPSDKETKQPRLSFKGQRYCFVAAITSWNPAKRMSAVQTEADLPHLILPSVWSFKSQKASGDYHKNFNGTNFVHWFETQLLPNLTQPSLIRLDNASYHLCKPPATPKASRKKKAEIQVMLQQLGIAFTAADLMPALRAKLKTFIDAVEAEIVTLAAAKGHKVIFTPPYACELQPIELVWSIVKGGVGRQYDDATTLTQVKERLDAEFSKVAADRGVIGRIYAHVGRIEKQYVMAEEEDDEFVQSDSDAEVDMKQEAADMKPNEFGGGADTDEWNSDDDSDPNDAEEEQSGDDGFSSDCEEDDHEDDSHL